MEPGDALDEEAVVDAADQVGLALLSGERGVGHRRTGRS